MDSLLPVFVAVLLAETGGRIQALTAALRLRFPESAKTILTALALTSIASLIIAAIGGAIVAGMVDYPARTLLSGLALAFAGVPMLLTMKPPEAPGATPLAAGFRAYLPAQIGDASQFIVFAMAARGGAPVLAFAAGLTAILATASAPLLLANEWPGKLPLNAIRRGIGVFLMSAGVVFAAGAFRVI